MRRLEIHSNRYDNVASHMGVNANKFTTLYDGDMLRVRRRFGEYIKGLSKQKGLIDYFPANYEENMPVVSITANGYPMLPPVDLASKTKEYLALLMRQYLSKHYSALQHIMIAIKLTFVELASGGHSEHVPFASIKSNRSRFIEDIYFPFESNMCLTDPHNMKKQQILDFLDHAKERQVRYGAEAAFWFRVYQKKSTLYPALYVYKGGCGSMAVGEQGVVHQEPGESHEPSITQPRLPSATEVPQASSLSASHHSAASDGIQDADDLVKVNHEQMMVLLSHGMDPVQPANGPNEGEPYYIVPAAVLMYLDCKWNLLECWELV